MTMLRRTHFIRIAIAGVALTLAACAATTLKNSWRDPAYQGPPLKKIMVIGVTSQADRRRSFEDGFVKALKASGVEGIASYTLMPQDGKAEEAQVKDAVVRAGADGVLVTRIVKLDVNTTVTQPSAAMPGMRAGFYGGYAGAWGGYYEPPMAYQTETLVLETGLYGMKDTQLLWSGSTETFEPASSIQENIAQFAEVIIKALKSQKLI